MATSSITTTFVISEKKQIEQFANAIEESYRESLKEREKPDWKVTYLHGSDEVRRFMEQRKRFKCE